MTTAQVVAGIAAGDDAASEEFYAMLKRTLGRRARQQLSVMDAEDIIHDAYILCVEAIRGGKVKQPERMMGYARTIGIVLIANSINERVLRRERLMRHEEWAITPSQRIDAAGDAIGAVFVQDAQNPEQAAIEHEHADIIHIAIQCASANGHSRGQAAILALTAQGHTRKAVLGITGLDENEYRCCKSRAKFRFIATAQRLIQRAPSWRQALRKAHAAAA